MSKFEIGEQVDNAADGDERARSLPCFQQLTAPLGTPLTPRGTARSNFSLRKNWSFTSPAPERTNATRS